MRKPKRVSHMALLGAGILIVSTSTAEHRAIADEWGASGGPYGGGVLALSIDGAGGVYAARSDNVFRSDDGGASWINVSKGAINAEILCFTTSASGNLYAGVFSRGVYWSFDGGQSWDHDQITHDPQHPTDHAEIDKSWILR